MVAGSSPSFETRYRWWRVLPLLSRLVTDGGGFSPPFEIRHRWWRVALRIPSRSVIDDSGSPSFRQRPVTEDKARGQESPQVHRWWSELVLKPVSTYEAVSLPMVGAGRRAYEVFEEESVKTGNNLFFFPFGICADSPSFIWGAVLQSQDSSVLVRTLAVRISMPLFPDPGCNRLARGKCRRLFWANYRHYSHTRSFF